MWRASGEPKVLCNVWAPLFFFSHGASTLSFSFSFGASLGAPAATCSTLAPPARPIFQRARDPVAPDHLHRRCARRDNPCAHGVPLTEHRSREPKFQASSPFGKRDVVSPPDRPLWPRLLPRRLQGAD